MSNVLPLPQKPRHRRKLVVFERGELGQLLNLYSTRVASGEWRDYAIDFRQGMALFSIFRHAAEQPLFAIAKLAPGSQRQGDYVVVSGPRKIAQGKSIGEVLAALERQLRLVYSN
jgi:hypothetical protein